MAGGPENELTLDVVTPDSEAFRQLSECRGALFDEWVACWNGLSDAERDPFTHPVWAMAFITAWFLDDPDLRIYLARENGRLLGALPFRIVWTRTALGRHARLEYPTNRHAGGASVALPTGRHRDVFERIFDREVAPGKRPQMLHFTRVDEGNPVLDLDLPRWLHASIPRAVIRMQGDFETLRAGLSRNFKNQLRKSRRNLGRLPDVSFETVDDPALLGTAFDEYMELEVRGWKGQQGDKQADKRSAGLALKLDAATRSYYAFAVAHMPLFAATAIFFLRSAGQAIAGAVCFQSGRTLMMGKITYDEEHAQASPGQLLTAHILESYFPGRERDALNFVGWYQWHERWKPELQRVFNLRLFPAGARGLPARWRALRLRDKLRWARMRAGLLDSADRIKAAS